jgi:hypothetical protein
MAKYGQVSFTLS